MPGDFTDQANISQMTRTARASADLARLALSSGNSAALALLAAASFDALRLSGALSAWRPRSGRRSRSVLAALDLLRAYGDRGLVVAAGRGQPGEGAEIAAGLQYAAALLSANLHD